MPKLSTLLTPVAAVLAVAATVLAYVVPRYAPDSLFTSLAILTAVILVVVAVLGFLSARAGSVAPFIAIAILLPFTFMAAFVVGSAQRLGEELEGIFGTDETSTEQEEFGDAPLEEDFEEPEPSDQTKVWGERWCDVKLGMTKDEAVEIMGDEPTGTFDGALEWTDNPDEANMAYGFTVLLEGGEVSGLYGYAGPLELPCVGADNQRTDIDQ